MAVRNGCPCHKSGDSSLVPFCSENREALLLNRASVDVTPARLVLLETDWECCNHAKIGSVTSDAELGGDTEHRAIP